MKRIKILRRALKAYAKATQEGIDSLNKQSRALHQYRNRVARAIPEVAQRARECGLEGNARKLESKASKLGRAAWEDALKAMAPASRKRIDKTLADVGAACKVLDTWAIRPLPKRLKHSE